MLSFRVALRYLLSKKSHNSVNVISIVSILGIAVATAAIVCVLSIFNGFSDLAVNRLSKFNPQIKVTSVHGKTINNADSLVAILKKLPEVASAIPTISEQALAMYRGAQMAITLQGVPESYSSVTEIESAIIDGQYLTSEVDMPMATLSVGVAMRLKAFPGADELLSVYVPKRTGRINTANPMASFRSDSMFIGGVYRFNDNEQDIQTIIVPIGIARNLLNYDSCHATSIEISLAPEVSDMRGLETIIKTLPPGLTAKDRMQQEAQSFKMISVEKWITFVMLAFILVIASFNVISTLSMLIIEKKDNMRTLRSMGAGIPIIRRIFMWEGWLISIVGGMTGIILGAALTVAQQYGGFIKLNADPETLAVTSYPVRLDMADLTIVLLLIIVIGLLVGTLTSRFAAKAR